MVFSTSLSADHYGRAIVVPYCQRVRSAADVVDEAVRLWTAETSDGKNETVSSVCRIRMGVRGPTAESAASAAC